MRNTILPSYKCPLQVAIQFPLSRHLLSAQNLRHRLFQTPLVRHHALVHPSIYLACPRKQGHQVVKARTHRPIMTSTRCYHGHCPSTICARSSRMNPPHRVRRPPLTPHFKHRLSDHLHCPSPTLIPILGQVNQNPRHLPAVTHIPAPTVRHPLLPFGNLTPSVGRVHTGPR